MSLFFANIDERYADILESRIKSALFDFRIYVETARRYLDESGFYFSIESIDETEKQEILEQIEKQDQEKGRRRRSKRDSLYKKRRLNKLINSYWYRIKEDEGSPLKEDEMKEILNSPEYYPTDKAKSWEKIWRLGKLEEEQILIFRNQVNFDQLYVRPNTYQLEAQFKAILSLAEAPNVFYRPLLRLFESRTVPNVGVWPDFAFDPIDEWYVLDQDSFDGIEDQREFVQKAMSTPDFAILEGPPGSGKTQVITEIVLQCIDRGERVLLCAPTHVAVDNVLERLVKFDEKGDLVALRIGEIDNIDDDLHLYSLENRGMSERNRLLDFLEAVEEKSQLNDAQDYLKKSLLEDKDANSIKDLLLETADLVCGTTIGILQYPEFKKAFQKARSSYNRVIPYRPIFDVLIVDEASKVTFNEFLVPALFAKKWLIVGDIKQLSPYVEDEHLKANIDASIKSDLLKEFLLYSFQSNQKFGFLPRFIELTDEITEIEKKEYIEFMKSHSESQKIEFINLEDSLYNKKETDLSLLAGQLFVGTRYNLAKHLTRLPPFILKIPEDFDQEKLISYSLFQEACKKNAFKKNLLAKRIFNEDGTFFDTDDQGWAGNISWRLIRAFETKKDEEKHNFFMENINKLLPPKETYIANILNGNHIYRMVHSIRRISLPSVIQLLLEGYEPYRETRAITVLTDGFPESSVESRRTKLRYQYRMHPQISKFPREAFYDEEQLQDSNFVIQNRDWSYGKYKNKVVWIDVYPYKRRNGYAKDRNPYVAEQIIVEVDKFVDWASITPNKNHKRGLWSVGILTYYTAQEREIRFRLRKQFRKKSYRNFYLKKQNVKIRLATIDRFQGHEADIVFLSLSRSRTRTVGFMDSPNRMNVGLTRARYQLVIVGDKRYYEGSFKGKIIPDQWKNLASSTSRIKPF